MMNLNSPGKGRAPLSLPQDNEKRAIRPGHVASHALKSGQAPCLMFLSLKESCKAASWLRWPSCKPQSYPSGQGHFMFMVNPPLSKFPGHGSLI